MCLMSPGGMLPFSLADRGGYFDKSNSTFSSSNTSRAPFSQIEGGPFLGKFTMPSLHVKTSMMNDAPSPPPPALSPATSISSILPDGNFNQTSSPSPPVIVAEIASNASSCSKDSVDKNPEVRLGFNTIKPHANSTDFSSNPPRLPTSASTVPRISSISSSSPSSSSTSSSSSTCNEYVEQKTNSLPILEKISRVLGSPALNFDASPTVRLSALSPELIAAQQAHASDLQDSQKSLGDPHDFPVPLSEPVLSSRMSAAKPKTKKSGAARKSGRCKKRQFDSDSDYELGQSNVNLGRLPRGRASATTVTSRVKQTLPNKRTRCSHDAAPQPVNTSEASASRRYLESPFLCLCQSRGTVVDLSQTSFLSESKPPPSESIALSAALPAHVISPAIQGISSTIDPCAPSTCPMLGSCTGDRGILDAYRDSTEAKTIFSGLSYRPSPQIRSRELPALTETTPERPWICVFCGQDNTSLDLGFLYGPYWLCDVERLQLPPGAIAAISAPGKATKTSETMCKRAGGRIRSGVITSTLTRSAAAQGRSTVAKTGELRLVIKAQTTACPGPSGKRGSGSFDRVRPRVASTGEVWFHMDCLLWAPGTRVNGSGTVIGLEEAIQLALDTTCSTCDKIGAILSCCSRGCHLSFHYHCALLADCQLNHDQYSLYCSKHKPLS